LNSLSLPEKKKNQLLEIKKKQLQDNLLFVVLPASLNPTSASSSEFHCMGKDIKHMESK
jgi:hypothetical protein